MAVRKLRILDRDTALNAWWASPLGRALLAAGYPPGEVAASLAFQHANHSVRVTDEFMRLAVNGGD